jgi:hypothetical protein
MKEDEQRFLSLFRQLLACLTAEQAPWVLNCQPHELPILLAASPVKPLGGLPPNSVRYFAASELLELAKDWAWLAKVTNAVNKNWQRRNQRKQGSFLSNSDNGYPMLTATANG